MDANGAASDTYGTPPTWRAAAASSAALGRPPDAAPDRSRFSSSRTRDWSSSTRDGRASGVWAPAASAARSRVSNCSCIRASAASPVTASTRRMPLPMERSEVMMKPPTCPDARQCVPPQSSKLS